MFNNKTFQVFMFMLLVFSCFGCTSSLVYSTFLGDSGSGLAAWQYGITVDKLGNAYIVGSASPDFPTTSGAFDTSYNSGTADVFVTKLNADGTALIYSTFIGGSGDDYGYDIAIDNAGNAYITGYTSSTNFPTTPEAFDTSFNGGSAPSIYDAFVSKLNSNGSALVYSTFLGGNGYERGYGIAVDSTGNAYITGMTNSSNFPITIGAYDTTYNGSNDVFVTKLNASGSALVYSTYIGGSNSEYGRDLALDTAGNVYITGDTFSPNFPTLPGAFDSTYDGLLNNVFVSKLNTDGSALVYSTYLGGGGHYSYGFAIAVDNSENAYITGWTESPDFPVTVNAFDTTFNGVCNVFVTKLNTAGSALIYSTFLGGSYTSFGRAIALDNAGNAYLSGWTLSTDFPVTPDAIDTTFNGKERIIISKLTADGSALIYSSLLGGSGPDRSFTIASDDKSNIYITGMTSSSDFPITPGAFCSTYHYVFVSKLYIGTTAIDESFWQDYQ